MEDPKDFSNESVSKLKYNLNYYGADYPTDALVKRMINEDFIFPNFQRQYVWKTEEASRFIESLLLGLPVPSIFLAKDKYSSKLIVIDGQQRLRTLQFFYEGKFPDNKPFKLKNVVPHLKGLTYEDLSIEDRVNLDNTIMHCIIIAENEHSDSIFYLFERLNTSGTPLTNQEIRNAIYHGPFNELLHHLVKDDVWKDLYHKRSDRLEDEELLLRFFALAFEFEKYSGSLNEFLNMYMLHNRNFELVSERDIINVFKAVFHKIHSTIGNQAFYFKKQFNRSLFETITLFVYTNNHNPLDEKKLIKFHSSLIDDESFWDLSKSATTSKRNISARLELAKDLYHSLN